MPIIRNKKKNNKLKRKKRRIDEAIISIARPSLPP